MKTRRQEVSEDRLTITQTNKRLKTSTSGTENSEPIPTDLVIEVLSRLPVKSIARIRCVSKPWASILLRPDFTELFLTRSSACPKILFACESIGARKLFFFSSPQPQNPDVSSSLVAANYHMSFPFDFGSYEVLRSVHGLICLKHQRILNGKKETVLEICNPSTGRSLTSPKVKTRRVKASSFLGYDPIEKQFKLLSMTLLSYGRHFPDTSAEHQILTLGTGTLSWRMIECSIPHYPLSDWICINGVLYYLAGVGGYGVDHGIVCFDIKSEKFKFIQAANNVLRVKLVNYMGKLATLKSDDEYTKRINGKSTSLELCVLEEDEWSNHTYVLPPLWKDLVADAELSFVGVTRTGEIVMSPNEIADGFYLIYYNLERNTIRRVEIQGIDASKYSIVHTFLDHVEDVKLWPCV